MLYACSIFYRTQLPLVVCFNKIDVVSHEFAVEWMTDYDAFVEALRSERDDSYMSTLVRSMGLNLQEFYETLRTVGVSASTGMGMEDLFEAIDEAAQLYNKEYAPALEARKAASASQSDATATQANRERFEADFARDKAKMSNTAPPATQDNTTTTSSTSVAE